MSKRLLLEVELTVVAHMEAAEVDHIEVDHIEADHTEAGHIEVGHIEVELHNSLAGVEVDIRLLWRRWIHLLRSCRRGV